MDAGDSIVLCVTSESADITTTGEVLIERSVMPCKVKSLGSCGSYEWNLNPDAVFTSCGTITTNTSVGLTGQKALKITANASTIITIAFSEVVIDGCFAGGAVTTCDQCVVDAVDASTVVLEDILATLQGQKEINYIPLRDCDGTVYYSKISYDETTGAETITNIDVLGAAYVPTCANPISNDIEATQTCFQVVNPFAGLLVGDQITRVQFWDASVSPQALVGTVFTDALGAIVVPGAGDVVPCISTSKSVRSIERYDIDNNCPNITPFVRHLVSENGVDTSFFDTAVDGITPYTVIGSIQRSIPQTYISSEALAITSAAYTAPALAGCATIMEIQTVSGLNFRYALDGGTIWHVSRDGMLTIASEDQISRVVFQSVAPAETLHINYFFGEPNPTDQ